MELKDRIIQSAYDLFSTKGFTKTTITDLVKASGTSKGGFYHHFSSKEDIVNHIMVMYLEDILSFFDHLFVKHDNDLIKVFIGVFEAINDYKRDQFQKWPEMMKLLSFPGNDLIIMRMGQSFEKSTIDFYNKVITKGNGDLWQVPSPKNIAGLWARELLRIYSQLTQTLYDWTPENIKVVEDLLDFDENLINNLLGIDQIRIKDIVLAYMHDAKKAMTDMNM